MVVEVEAEDGTCGVGVTIGGEAGCYIVEHHFSRFCEGQDPRNIEPRQDLQPKWPSQTWFIARLYVRTSSDNIDCLQNTRRCIFNIPDIKPGVGHLARTGVGGVLYKLNMRWVLSH